MKHLDLFSGIGGFALGLQWAGGFETVAFCEIDKFCQKVLAKNFPNVPIFGDIHELTTDALERRGVTRIKLVSAGFPCQPFSVAGSRKGIEDERFLWAELFRVIATVEPKYLLIENVANLLKIQEGLIFAGILYDLSSMGYACEWGVIPASAVGAPHRRDRLFVVAYPDQVRTGYSRQSRTIYHANGNGANKKQGWQIIQHGTTRLCSDVSNANINRCGRRSPQHQKAETETRGLFFTPTGLSLPTGRKWDDLPTSRICRSSDGIPNRMDRLESLGNAVVPQLVQMLGQRLIEFDKEQNEAD